MKEKKEIVRDDNTRKSIFLEIIKGSVISVVITIILLIILSTLLVFTNLNENITKPLILLITGVSIIIGSFISSRKLNIKGIINGGAVGAIYILTIYLLSSICFGVFGRLNIYSFTIMFIAIITGIVGGIIGVNFKR